jgi:hypothetical protein
VDVVDTRTDAVGEPGGVEIAEHPFEKAQVTAQSFCLDSRTRSPSAIYDRVRRG